MILNRKGRTVFETLLVIILVSLLLVFFTTYFKRTVMVAREYSLISELSNIRTSILLYLVLNKRFPESLKQLVEEDIILPMQDIKIIEKSYLKTVSMDEEGYPLDPLGNRFGYNPESGLVWSTTKGYEGW